MLPTTTTPSNPLRVRGGQRGPCPGQRGCPFQLAALPCSHAEGLGETTIGSDSSVVAQGSEELGSPRLGVLLQVLVALHLNEAADSPVLCEPKIVVYDHLQGHGSQDRSCGAGSPWLGGG